MHDGPDECHNDLLRRRGRILGVEEKHPGAEIIIRAEAPLAELFGYTGAIRSLSRGRATHSMRPCRYEPAPAKPTPG